MTARERENAGQGQGPPTRPADFSFRQPSKSVTQQLDALRRQIGEDAWADRLERARERETVVLAVLELQKQGLSRAAALRKIGKPAADATVAEWIGKYRGGGLLNLVERWGGVAAPREPTTKAPPPPRKQGNRGKKAVSFLKWAGGKTSVAERIIAHKPERYSVYYEPMVGAGSVFLKLQPKRAVLADTNGELMNCYEVIRDDVERLIVELAKHRNTYEHFVAVRAQQPDDLPPVERAARTIFLNKTCFNGLYRVNKRGRFNVPFGKYDNPNFCDVPTLERVSRQLQGVTLLCCDFEQALQDVPPDSFVYFDPPYYHDDPNRQFNYYHPHAFGEDDHRRLAAVFRELDLLGCHLLLSNSDHPFVRELYDGYPIETIKLRRPINATVEGRSGWTEVLIHNRRSK